MYPTIFHRDDTQSKKYFQSYVISSKTTEQSLHIYIFNMRGCFYINRINVFAQTAMTFSAGKELHINRQNLLGLIVGKQLLKL